MPWPTRLTLRSLAAGGAVCAGGLAGCASSGGRGSAEPAAVVSAPVPSALAAGSRPDVVIVLADGLRDGEGELHRAAAAFAAAALPPGAEVRRYAAAYTASIEPFVALGSMLTARYPSQVPLCSWPDELRPTKPWCATIPPGSRTLGEVAGVYGYATALVTVVQPEEDSVGRGFDVHVEPTAGRGAAGWAWAADTASAWWAAHAATPRLLVVQVPLELTAARTLAASTYEGAFGAAMEAREPDPDGSADLRQYQLPYGERPLEAALSDLRLSYAAAATEAGTGAAALLARLPADRPRLTVLTSLHGLSLGEYGGTSHPEQLEAVGTRLLLERTVHVPLWLLGAGASPDVSAPVELLDVGPTVFSLVGATPPAGLVGHDLLAADADPAPTAYAEFGDMLFLRDGARVVTFRSERHGTSSVDPELTSRLRTVAADAPAAFLVHDVVADPLQADELGRRDPDARLRLHDLLVALRTGPASPPEGVSAEDAGQLSELRTKGYW